MRNCFADPVCIPRHIKHDLDPASVFPIRFIKINSLRDKIRVGSRSPNRVVLKIEMTDPKASRIFADSYGTHPYPHLRVLRSVEIHASTYLCAFIHIQKATSRSRCTLLKTNRVTVQRRGIGMKSPSVRDAGIVWKIGGVGKIPKLCDVASLAIAVVVDDSFVFLVTLLGVNERNLQRVRVARERFAAGKA